MTSRADVVVVGDELLSGRTRDGNGAWLAARLLALGFEVGGIHVVGDAADAVARGVARAAEGASVVVVSGGLGPTDDDGTRAGLARAVGRPRSTLEEPTRKQRNQHRHRAHDHPE